MTTKILILVATLALAGCGQVGGPNWRDYVGREGDIYWTEVAMVTSGDRSNPKRIQLGCRDDGVVVWRKMHKP